MKEIRTNNKKIWGKKKFKPPLLKGMEQHVDENAQPEVNVVSLVLWLVTMFPLFGCSAICRADTGFTRSRPTMNNKYNPFPTFPAKTFYLVT